MRRESTEINNVKCNKIKNVYYKFIKFIERRKLSLKYHVMK